MELLRAGATGAVNVELSPEYEDAAHKLMHSAGFEDRVERRLGDFALESDALEPADIVVMHRVICCYHDMPLLVSAAAAKAGTYLALAFPRDRALTRTGIRTLTVGYRLRRMDFRTFVHKPLEIVRVAREAGLRPVFARNGIAWQTLVLERGDVADRGTVGTAAAN